MSQRRSTAAPPRTYQAGSVRGTGAAIALQLFHAGRYASGDGWGRGQRAHPCEQFGPWSDLADAELVEQRAHAALAAVRAGFAAQERLEPLGCDRIRRAHAIPPLLPGARARGRVVWCTRSA